ncbi:MAG: hypothetical protein EG826_10850 [Deltaproteobacteria bacterium]|nr:hypothetical protein [Deltaproteobacteria bacterium]
MKKLFFLLTFFWASSVACAQTSLTAYLAELPLPPKICCGVPEQDKASFRASVRSVESAMQKDLRERKKASKDYVEANRSKIEDSMTPQSVQTDKPRKSGRLTKEEKKARAEEMMRQYGVSPEDRKKLKTMSQEEKTAWALQTSGNASAKMQDDPNVRRLKEQGEAIRAGQPDLKAALARVESREAAIAAVTRKISALDQHAAAAREKNIAPLERELAKFSDIISDAQAAQVKRLDDRKRKAQTTHCETYAPQYAALLTEYASAVRESLPDFRRLDEATTETQMIQTDKPVETFAGTDRGMKAVNGYADALSRVFKYDPAR